MSKLKLGVLASGGGTNLQAIIDACKEGRLDASVNVVISNNSGSRAMARARDEGIACRHLSRATHPEPEALDSTIRDTLTQHGVEVVVMAGYMRPLGPLTLGWYAGRVLNSHPGLLPKFGGKGMYGGFVHEAVLAAGESVTGVTIHIADEKYDHGPIVAQCEVPVFEDDTLESLTDRVQTREREFWIETLEKIAGKSIDLDELMKSQQSVLP